MQEILFWSAGKLLLFIIVRLNSSECVVVALWMDGQEEGRAMVAANGQNQNNVTNILICSCVCLNCGLCTKFGPLG